MLGLLRQQLSDLLLPSKKTNHKTGWIAQFPNWGYDYHGNLGAFGLFILFWLVDGI